MLVTARSNHGPVDDRGVIGHATSPDLETWTVQPPLSAPGAGFAHLEVPQIECIDGQWVLLFSSGPATTVATHPFADAEAGTWVLPVQDPLGPYPVERAQPLTRHEQYSARAVQRRDGSWALLAFGNPPPPEPFPGTISDPMGLVLDEAGYPRLSVHT